ncbi:hypothetical protein ACHAXR_003425 [Thalassiosira sp. AJA248-18]
MQPSVPAPAPGGVDDALYGTLDLGHQTQINDDLVRTIRDEIVEIDKSLQFASGNVKNMERSFGQLTKDNNHSRGEMFNHRRGASEVLDSENFAEEVRVGFKEQFATEVAPHVVVSPENTAHHHDHDALGVSSEDGSGGVGPEGSSSGKRTFSHKKFIAHKNSAAKNKAVSIRSIQQEIKMTRKKIKATDEETANFIQDMNARQLDKVKLEGGRQVDAKRRELEAESQRNRGVKEAVQVARANSGAYAQKIAEKAKEQMSERSNNVSKESTMASLNDAKQQELTLLEAEEKKLDMELAALSGQLDFLAKQGAEFEAEQQKSTTFKIDAEEVQRDIGELTSSKEGKSKEADASNAELLSAIAAFEEASKAVTDSNAEKAENEKATVEVLEPAVARKADAIKEKEELAGEVVELQKTIEQAQNSNKDSVADSETKVTAKSNELKDHKGKLEEARTSFEQLQKDDAIAQENLSSELNEYKEFAVKFEAATKAEIDRLEVLKRERVDARVSQLEKRRSGLDAIEDSQMSDVDNLKQLNSYLQEMKELKGKIEEGEIAFDENGDELQPIGLDDDGHDDRDDMKNEDGSPAVKRG